jgi:hypothetical protein
VRIQVAALLLGLMASSGKAQSLFHASNAPPLSYGSASQVTNPVLSFPRSDWEGSFGKWASGSQTGVAQSTSKTYDYEKGEDREASTRTKDKASTFIPLDSWIYPSLDRLAAMGYMPSNTTIVRPLTRLECARLLAVAHVHIEEADVTTEQMIAALDTEFVRETAIIDGDGNRDAEIDSTYARFTEISGTPLRDGFHFAQSLVNDYGRPYGEGPNSIAGFSGRAADGPFALYVSAEYQYASPIPKYNLAAQQALLSSDPQPGTLPYGWNLRFGTANRIRPLEAYAALNLHNWQLSFGQQALWWGADRSTSLMLSNNAAPMPMLRLTRVKPLNWPFFGPVHFDVFMARQGGIHYVGLGEGFALFGSPSQALTPPPYIWGVSATAKFTRNFEFGAAHTTIFSGYGRPLTFGTFFHSFSQNGNTQPLDPGKRVTEFNLSYRVPFFAKSFSVYTEMMAWDNPFQGKFVARYAMDPGIYFPELPKIKNLDLRVEGVYTDLPKQVFQGYFYSNPHYPQGYTNYGQILGSWVGREGVGGQASSTYWFSPRKKVTLTYRKMVSDRSLFGGGSAGDLAGSVSWTIHDTVEFSAVGQFERWGFPLLGAGPRTNFTGSFEVRLYPKSRARRN